MTPSNLNSTQPDWADNNNYDWTSPTGLTRLKELLRPHLPYEPAPHQLVSTAKILVGQHVMCIWATGEGKSSVFYLHALARRGTLTIVVSPTNTLEADMVRVAAIYQLYILTDLLLVCYPQVQRLERMGITAVAVNRDTLKTAAKQRPAGDLWGEVRKGAYHVVLLSPEMLQTEAFNAAIRDPAVRARLAVFCVDECHLIDEWGVDFRTAYGAIKDTIPWLPTWTVRASLTATLEPGRQTTVVMAALGFTASNVFLDRRDCERTSIDIVIRPVQYSISTNEFLDLDELIPSDLQKVADVPKTLIYCETIELGHRVAAYLRRLLPAHLQKDGHTIIRHANSLNCPKCKEELLEVLYQSGNSRTCAIVVATDVLGVGMDVQDYNRVICFPTPSSLSALVQRVGRTSRGRDQHGTAYVYIKKSDIEAVSAYLQTAQVLDPRILRPAVSEQDKDRPALSPCQGPPTAAIPVPARVTRQTSSRIRSDAFQKNMALWCVVAAFVQGVCIVRQLNIIQCNPGISRDCGRCSSCRPRPLPAPRSRSSPISPPQPSPTMNDTAQQQPPPPNDSSSTTVAKPPPRLRLNATDLESLTAKIEVVAVKVRAQLPYPPDALLIGGKAFLDRRWITRITEDFALVTTQDVLKARLEGWVHWDYYGDVLWREISRLHSDVCKELLERHEKRVQDRRSKRKGKDREGDDCEEEKVRSFVLTHGGRCIKRVKLRLGSSNVPGKNIDTENISLKDHRTDVTADGCADTRKAACTGSPSCRNLNARLPLSPRKPRNGTYIVLLLFRHYSALTRLRIITPV